MVDNQKQKQYSIPNIFETDKYTDETLYGFYDVTEHFERINNMSRFVTKNSYDYSEAIHENYVYGFRGVCFKLGYGEVQNKGIVL